MFPYGAFFFLCFWWNVYWSALVAQNLSCPEKCLVAHLHLGFLLFAKRSILNVWQYSKFALSLNNFSVICEVTLCYLLHLRYSGFSHIQNSIYSGICRHIQTYLALLSHIHAYWGIIKAYSAPCKTPAYSKPCHITSSGIFRTAAIFKTLWNFDQAYSEICLSQNGLLRHYSLIFRYSQNFVKRLHM